MAECVYTSLCISITGQFLLFSFLYTPSENSKRDISRFSQRMIPHVRLSFKISLFSFSFDVYFLNENVFSSFFANSSMMYDAKVFSLASSAYNPIFKMLSSVSDVVLRVKAKIGIASNEITNMGFLISLLTSITHNVKKIRKCFIVFSSIMFYLNFFLL